MRRGTALVTLILLASGLAIAPANAAAKAGSACAKKGATVTQAGKRLVCTVSGKRLVWRLAPVVKRPTPSPTALAPGDFTVVAPAKRVAIPKWDGRDFDERAWSTGQLTGTVSVVNVWASWCGPCRQEWDDLQAAAAAHREVRFIGLNSLDRIDDARAFLKEHPSNYLQVFDGRGVVSLSLTTVPNRVFPITLVIDTQGRIAAWVPGPTTTAQISRALAAV